MKYSLDPQSQEIEVDVQSFWSKRAQPEDSPHFMLLMADRFRVLRRCSLKRSRSRLPLSPMYRQLQRRQEMQHTTFSNWQLKWSRMLCALFGPCTRVWEAMCLHATRPPAGQWTGIGERQRGIGGVYKDITEVSLGSIWYQRGFGVNPACPEPEDKMLKLSSKIRLVPTLNALPTRL